MVGTAWWVAQIITTSLIGISLLGNRIDKDQSILLMDIWHLSLAWRLVCSYFVATMSVLSSAASSLLSIVNLSLSLSPYWGMFAMVLACTFWFRMLPASLI